MQVPVDILKLAALIYAGVQAVKKSPLVKMASEDGPVLKHIKKVLAAELAQEEEIDRKVRAKLSSYSRGIVEGSSEWDVLYRKTFEEELRRHGRG